MNRRTLHSALAAIVTAFAVLATGCGPSTGGTGTGATGIGLSHFQATPLPLCSAAIAGAAGCLATAPGADRSAARFASAGADLVATIEGDALVIEARCSNLHFEGTWATSPALGPRFYGAILGGSPAGQGEPASVAAQLAGNGSAIELALYGAQQELLLGPVLLAPVATLPVPGPCP